MSVQRLTRNQVKHRASSIGRLIAGVCDEDRLILWRLAKVYAELSLQADGAVERALDKLLKADGNSHTGQIQIPSSEVHGEVARTARGAALPGEGGSGQEAVQASRRIIDGSKNGRRSGCYSHQQPQEVSA